MEQKKYKTVIDEYEITITPHKDKSVHILIEGADNAYWYEDTAIDYTFETTSTLYKIGQYIVKTFKKGKRKNE